MEGAQLTARGIGALTDEAGRATLRLPAGTHEVRVERIGYRTTRVTVTVTVPVGGSSEVVVRLAEQAIEAEEIIVTSTRTDRRIEDEPLRVEVVAREEVEEKLLMTPGDIAMLLNETAGLRVQPTAPSLGGASVRIQGLRGKYTQILSDGLPLYGGQTGALGPLQIPPMDLGQVEVIKGVASALYGASALGGVVNLVSRRPAAEPELELLANETTLGGTDVVGWRSSMLNDHWGYTLLASGHRQGVADVDDDGWADLPSFRRAVVRPRVVWNDGRGGNVLFTIGAMAENREGGTVPGRETPAGTTYREGLKTRRGDLGLTARTLVGGSHMLSLRASGALQRHDHTFGDRVEPDRHGTGFIEGALSGSGAHTWLVGVALQHDELDADVVGFDYAHTVPGVFGQDEWSPAEWLSFSASGRLDHHGEYGVFFNPRVSALLRPEPWTVRASLGTGYFAPTPWTDESEAVGLGRVVPLSGLVAERARSGSFDVGRVAGPFELNLTVFGSVIEDPVQARSRSSDGRLVLSNATAPVRTVGTESLVRFERGPFHLAATHVWMHSTEADPSGALRREVPLTPSSTGSLVGAWEEEGRARYGIELYFTGSQSVEGDPYRGRAPSQFVCGFLIEHRFGPIRAFLNAENVFDERQTRHDPLLLPVRSPDGRWITDVWGSLEGRSFNAGLRWIPER